MKVESTAAFQCLLRVKSLDLILGRNNLGILSTLTHNINLVLIYYPFLGNIIVEVMSILKYMLKQFRTSYKQVPLHFNNPLLKISTFLISN